jgi:polyhydroxyalkanoate synthesis repressor PhaR
VPGGFAGESMRVIKKYPNRRLYDATASRYVTLDDIRKLVLDEVPFQVVDRKTGANITRAILLQVIVDQEEQGPALLSESFLAQVIRAYRSSGAASVQGVLERSLAQVLSARRDGAGAVGKEASGA